MKKLALVALFLGGCSWSTFDDLGDTTWVDSVGGASGVTPSEFISVAAPGVTSKNAVFVALGRATDSVGEYDYDANGKRSSKGVEVTAGATQFGAFGPGVTIAGDPYDNVVGVAAITGAANDGDTKVVSFSADDITTIVTQNDFNQPNNAPPLDGPIQATSLVYARTDDDGAGTTTTDVVLARGSQIALVSNALDSAATLSSCLGATSNDLVLTVASGDFDGVPGTDELVAVVNDGSGTSPQAIVFNGRAITTTWALDMTALQGCFSDGDPDRGPLARIQGPAGDPNWGKTMVVGDFDGDGDPDIAIGSPGSEKVSVYINNALTFTEVDITPPSDAAGFGTSLAAGDLDGDGHDELVVGAPQSDVAGVDQAGNAYVYSFDGTSFTSQMVLHDAQPEAEQKVGTSVGIVPWTMGGQRMLVVGADHEIFAYFRTSMYPDVRGR